MDVVCMCMYFYVEIMMWAMSKQMLFTARMKYVS